jgi:3D (Asp-Asp-Asp) domain-containing protein
MSQENKRRVKVFTGTCALTTAIGLSAALLVFAFVLVILPNVERAITSVAAMTIQANDGGEIIEFPPLIAELPTEVAIDYEVEQPTQAAITEQEVLERLESLKERMEDLREWQAEVLEEIEDLYIPEYTNLGEFRLTAYCLCFICTETYSYGYEDNAQNANGTQVTAHGTVPTYGRTIAADRRFPFGAEIYIEGLGWRTVEDRGGAIQNQRLDVFIPNHHSARSFGVQYAEVRIRTAHLDSVCPTLSESGTTLN